MRNSKKQSKQNLMETLIVYVGIGLFAGTPAFAENQIAITIDRQQLESEPGISHLYNQLRQESKKVCVGAGRIPAAGLISTSCINDQLSIFVSKIADARLTNFHNKKH